jgi:hypothetical protein
LQQLVNTVAPSLVSPALFISSANSIKSGEATTITAFGALEKSFKSEVSLQGKSAVLCYGIMDSFWGMACLPFDLNEAYYSGVTSEEALASVQNQPNGASIARATQLFGQKFVIRVNNSIKAAVGRFLSAKGASSIDSLQSLIIAQLQQDIFIKGLQSNSAFAYEISEMESKKKPRREGDDGGGFT